MVRSIISSLQVGKKLRHLLVSQQAIRVNDQPAFLTNRVHTGDWVTVEAVLEPASRIIPSQTMVINVVFEDDHVLIVDKPAGMVVHATGGYRTETLVSGIVAHMQAQGESYIIRPLHRLDRQTSGLLLVAKSKLAHERLVRNLRDRTVVREYTALVHGWFANEPFTLQAPIGLAPDSHIKRMVVDSGQSAATHFTCLKRYEETQASMVHASLLTGRTHQIRVHLAYLGHPIIGDTLYGRTSVEQAGRSDGTEGRHALHAARLSFIHPILGDKMEFTAPFPLDWVEMESMLYHLEK